MKQLVRTLLILGGATACERAEPVVDHHERPAVGNIGQTGRPRPAVANPLIDRNGAPAVGNIGQTGEIHADAVAALEAMGAQETTRRSERAKRAAAHAARAKSIRALPRPAPVEVAGAAPIAAPPVELAIRAAAEPREFRRERPLVNRQERPMVGNIPMKCASDCGSSRTLAFQSDQVTASPLVDQRERPMVGNTVSKGRKPSLKQTIKRYARSIEETRIHVRDAETEEMRTRYQAVLASQLATYKSLLDKQHEERAQGLEELE